MIKLIVLFFASLAVARGLMLRGSGAILQRPNSINNESQVGAKKSFLQINKNNGKPLLKINSYLQQYEDEQEQSYLQTKREEEKAIKMMLKKTDGRWNAANMYKGLIDVDFDDRRTRHYVLSELVRKFDLSSKLDKKVAEKCLDELNNRGSGKLTHSNESLEHLSILIHDVTGFNKDVKNELARISKEGRRHWSAVNVNKGLRLIGVADLSVQTNYMAKLVDKINSGSKPALDCLIKLDNLGSGKRPASDVEDVKKELDAELGPQDEFEKEEIRELLKKTDGRWNAANMYKGLMNMNPGDRRARLYVLKELVKIFLSSNVGAKDLAAQRLDQVESQGSGKQTHSKEKLELILGKIHELIRHFNSVN